MKQEILFNSSSVGVLMADNPKSSITEKQGEKLILLECKLLNGETLTNTQANEFDVLFKKRDAPFELSKGSKTYIENKWLRDRYFYYEPVTTPELEKGILSEKRALKLLDKVDPLNKKRKKNAMRFKDDYFTGEPDTFCTYFVEDIKCSWSVKTFFRSEITSVYKVQLQVYMHLLGIHHAKLRYCLVDTPREIVYKETERFYYKYGKDDTNPNYIKACEQALHNHEVEWIPAIDRVKTFDIEYDPELIKELQNRIDVAREYYLTLSL